MRDEKAGVRLGEEAVGTLRALGMDC